MPLLLILLCWPWFTWAGGSAAWQGSGMGANLSQRGIATLSPRLQPPETLSGKVTLVAWQYRLAQPAPSGLRVKLCAAGRCAVLDGPAGTTRALTGVSASQPLSFVWEVPGRGLFYPPLRVVSNQVIVNYMP